MRQRTFMIVVLIVLLGILGGLVLLYLNLNQPAQLPGRTQVKGITWIRSIYGYGKGKNELLNSPTGLAVDPQGRIFVADGQNGRVLIFDANGRYLGRLGTSGMGRGQLSYPQSIAADPQGNIYVGDPKRRMLVAFGPDLKFKDEIHGEAPLAVLATSDKIYVATLSSIVVLGKDLKVLEKWGKRGKAVGQFDFPHGLAQLKNGTLVVSDGNNMRLQALVNSRGQAAWVYGTPPESLFTRTRAFGLPAGVALDANQNIYVVDPLRSSVHVFNDKGKPLGEYGDIGQEDGQFYYPTDIAYLGGNDFVISDTFNNRLQVVRITGGGTLATSRIQSLWDALKNLWWCGLLALLLLGAMLYVFFRRRGDEEPDLE